MNNGEKFLAQEISEPQHMVEQSPVLLFCFNHVVCVVTAVHPFEDQVLRNCLRTLVSPIRNRIYSGFTPSRFLRLAAAW